MISIENKFLYPVKMNNSNENKYYVEIINKIDKNNFKVGILGLGYVGLPLSLNFCEKGIKVIGLDTNKKVLDKLKNSISHIDHIESSRIKNVMKCKLFYLQMILVKLKMLMLF